MQYTNNEELAALVLDWQSTGVMPDRLVEVVGLIVKGCRGGWTPAKREFYPWPDHNQDTLIRVWMLRDYFDVSNNLFALLTKIASDYLKRGTRNMRFWALLDSGNGSGSEHPRRRMTATKHKGAVYWKT
jgi:hypothetical protein